MPALVFSDLYGNNGLAFLIGDPSSGSVADRKRAINDAYIDLASVAGFWRKRSTTITMTAETVAYNLPDDFDRIFRLSYRETGRYLYIKVVSDSLWLEESATNAASAGTPEYARITQTSNTQNQVELTPPPSSQFVSSFSPITLEYFIEIVRLVSDTDEPILPANLRHHIVPVAGYKYALAQGDHNLANQLKADALFAKAAVLKHDLTRTGRPRQLRPVPGYWPQASRVQRDYGMS